MKVRITAFRHNGKRLTDAEIANQGPLEGELISAQVADKRGFYRRADLQAPKGSGLTDTLATLFEPELMQIGENMLLLRGIEKRAGRAYLQEWRCELI